MIKQVLQLFTILALTFTSFGQLSPVITSWQQNTTNIGFAGALTNVQQVNYSNTFVYVKTNDIPSWIPILYDWPNNPWFAVPMNYQFKFRLNPIPNVGPETKTGYGHIGLWKNGCSIYNPKDAKSYQDSSVWFQNAWYWEHLLGETFDSCIGHPNGSGEYHTHVSPACLYDIEDSMQASPLLGYAFDSYPIYVGYGYSNPLDTNSAIIRLKSSYRLRNITNRTTLANGTILPTSQHGPLLDSVPLGGYMEDYEYVSGLGDLDEHNGRFVITNDYPNGIYAYFTTIGWVSDTFDYSIKPVFPYVLGPVYYGEVYPSDGNTGPGSGFAVISEPVTPYVAVNSVESSLPKDTKISVYPNPFDSELNIEVENISDFNIEIKDLHGRSVMEDKNKSQIDCSSLKSGLYIIMIITNTGETKSFRMIK